MSVRDIKQVAHFNVAVTANCKVCPASDCNSNAAADECNFTAR